MSGNKALIHIIKRNALFTEIKWKCMKIFTATYSMQYIKKAFLLKWKNFSQTSRAALQTTLAFVILVVQSNRGLEP